MNNLLVGLSKMTTKIASIVVSMWFLILPSVFAQGEITDLIEGNRARIKMSLATVVFVLLVAGFFAISIIAKRKEKKGLAVVSLLVGIISIIAIIGFPSVLVCLLFIAGIIAVGIFAKREEVTWLAMTGWFVGIALAIILIGLLAF